MRLTQFVLPAILSCTYSFADSKDSLRISEPIVVSLAALLVNPEMYDGKLVSTDGYLEWDFENRALYLSKDLAKNAGSSSAIWVHSKESLGWYENGIVRLTGEFSAKGKGHLNAFAGSIVDAKAWRLPLPYRLQIYFLPALIFLSGAYLGWSLNNQ